MLQLYRAACSMVAWSRQAASSSSGGGGKPRHGRPRGRGACRTASTGGGRPGSGQRAATQRPQPVARAAAAAGGTGRRCTTAGHAGWPRRRRHPAAPCESMPFAGGGGVLPLRALTWSGSQISRSDGVHFRTKQITSRSSRRIVAGVLVHSADIFPALIYSPASARRRRIWADFQIPRSAAFIRRFQRTGSPRLLDQPGSHTGVGLGAGGLHGVVVHVDVAGGRGQPLVPENLLDRLQVQSR